MNEEPLGPAFERLYDSVQPPLDARDRVARRIAQRRRTRRTALVGFAVLVIGGGAVTAAAMRSAGTSDDGPVARVDDAVTCSSGEVVRTKASDRVWVPALESPVEAARAWAGPDAGAVDVDEGRRYAYLLREDGTVRARMTLSSTRVDLEASDPTAWSVNGSETCSDEVSAEPWPGPNLIECGGDATVRAAVRHSPTDGNGALTAESAVRRALAYTLTGSFTTGRTPTARSGDVTAELDLDGSIEIALRALRVGDTWRAYEIAACADRVPGWPAGGDLEAVPLQVGHCWVEPLVYDGSTWDLPEKKQFGSGGELPTNWIGLGLVSLEDDGTLQYVDAGGTTLTFLPADDPRTLKRTFCA